MSSCVVVIPDIYRGVFNFQEEKRRKKKGKRSERGKEEQQSGFTITVSVIMRNRRFNNAFDKFPKPIIFFKYVLIFL